MCDNYRLFHCFVASSLLKTSAYGSGMLELEVEGGPNFNSIPLMSMVTFSMLTVSAYFSQGRYKARMW